MEQEKIQTVQTSHASLPSDPTLGQLFTELTEDFSTLVRNEIALARTETVETVSTVARSTVTMIAGGVIAYAGLIVLLMAAAIGLAHMVPLWLSTLIVGIVTLVIGAILIFVGRQAISNASLVPEKTIETLKKDAEWAKEQVQ